MDIRTKLIFALVAASLGSMFVLGAVVSPRVEGYIRDGTLRQLDQLAEARTESLGWIVAGWLEGTVLVASRTQLRASLDDYVRTGSAEAAERIRAILSDALEASSSATLFEVYDPDGRMVASVERGDAAPTALPRESRPASESAGAAYVGVTVGSTGPPQVTLTAPMSRGGSEVGRLVAVFEAPQILELVGNDRDLGQTGEVLIVTRDAQGGLHTLHPTRYDEGRAGIVVLSTADDGLAERAMAGTSLLAGGVVDYRGEEVWAATRLVEETGWGLAVKVDRAEAVRSVTEFNAWLRRTALILSAFVIVVGLVLALRFALPIRALADVANRVRGGDMDARADVAREDELGLLARTFNDMTDELQQRLELLHQFRNFFDVTVDLMCIAGLDGYFKTTNPAFQRALGWSEHELTERPFLAFVHPDDVAKTEAEVAKLAEGIPTISFENRYRCKDGSYKLLHWTSYPEGEILYAIARVLGPSPE